MGTRLRGALSLPLFVPEGDVLTSLQTPGEDPTRIRGYTKALLHGLEHFGEQPIRKMIATCKHFAGYDLEIWYQYVRYGFNAIIGLQDLSEYYLPMFQQCARDSNVGAIMCSYNAINGTRRSLYHVCLTHQIQD